MKMDFEPPRKTIRAKIINLTSKKSRLLVKEYKNFQLYLNGLDWGTELYAATKQQADRLLDRINPLKEQPMILRRDSFRVVRRETKLSRWWAKIPVYSVRGGIFVPIAFSTKLEKIFLGSKMCDSKLVRKGDDFFLHLAIKKEIPAKKQYDDVIGIDMGIRSIAAVVQNSTRKPRFYGKELLGTMGHYFHMRKSVQTNKIKHLRRWLQKSREKNTINYWVHKYTKEIVEQAIRTNSFIVIGKLASIRKNLRGRKFNRKLNNWPFNKFASYIKYKANWEGIEVVEVSEAYTSQLCWRCDQKGIRKSGFFGCKFCKSEENADRNGTLNIAKRGIGQALSQGIILTNPRNLANEHDQIITSQICAK